MSVDAGRYLCEFIYYQSLRESQKSQIPVLFCHVPSENRPFKIPEMTEAIVQLACIMVDMKDKEGEEHVAVVVDLDEAIVV
jgi:pyrrolidone-carboxylate peptidase